jgi:hypothetical protein
MRRQRKHQLEMRWMVDCSAEIHSMTEGGCTRGRCREEEEEEWSLVKTSAV